MFKWIIRFLCVAGFFGLTGMALIVGHNFYLNFF